MKLLPALFNQQQATPQKTVKFRGNTNNDNNEVETLLQNSIKNSISNSKDISTIMEDPKKKGIFFDTLGSMMVTVAAQLTKILTANSTPENNTKIRKSNDGDVLEIRQTRVKEADADSVDEIKDAPIKDAVATGIEEIKDLQTKESGVGSAGTIRKTKIKNAEDTVKLIKHKGKQQEFEIQLLNEIQNIKERQELPTNKQSELHSLYNEFCGLNYKDSHYSQSNEKVDNKVIATNLTKDLQSCTTDDELTKIVDKYKGYSKESVISNVPEKKQEISIPPNANPETVEIVKNLKNIKEAYYKIGNEENSEDKMILVENFINAVSSTQKQKEVRYLSRINSNYSEHLYEMASIYNDLQYNDETEKKELFLALIFNKMVSPDALETWKKFNSIGLNFFEYNSMINNDLKGDTIKNIAIQKRNAKLNQIEMLSPDSFRIGFSNSSLMPVEKKLKSIQNIFKLINNADYKPLTASDKPFTIKDMEREIIDKRDSYPNLMNYLTKKKDGKEYLNQGSMTKLLELYNDNRINKNLFTMHSYLRFIERVVFNKINNQNYNILDGGVVNRNYVACLQELKNSLSSAMKNSIEVHTYAGEYDYVKAPKFEIPYKYGEDGKLTITINENNKIHTVF